MTAYMAIFFDANNVLGDKELLLPSLVHWERIFSGTSKPDVTRKSVQEVAGPSYEGSAKSLRA